MLDLSLSGPVGSKKKKNRNRHNRRLNKDLTEVQTELTRGGGAGGERRRNTGEGRKQEIGEGADTVGQTLGIRLSCHR